MLIPIKALASSAMLGKLYTLFIRANPLKSTWHASTPFVVAYAYERGYGALVKSPALETTLAGFESHLCSLSAGGS